MFSILVIDDEPNNFDVIETFLAHESHRLHYAASGQDALQSLDIFKPDLILLDVMMPGLDGIECCRRLKAMERWQSVPIIMVTALTTKADLVQCISAGADDFISKPVNRMELTARVRSMLRIRQQYQQLEEFNNRLEAMVQRRTTQLRQMVFQDALTGLPSRAGLLQMFKERQEIRQIHWGLMTLDCNQFKLVNGSFGHQVGDQLLVAIAQRLSRQISPGQLLGRTGGDEFSILIENGDCDDQLEVFVARILASFTASFWVESCEIFITVSIGVAKTTQPDQDGERLFQDADTAMYQAKLRGKSSYQIFDSQMHVAMLQRLTLENDLQLALKQSDFIVHYQPIFDLRTEQLAGFEALIRWRHPSRGLVSPGEFIPSMEMTGLIVSVGLWVLRQACEQLKIWHRRGGPKLTMSVNLSVRQFTSPTLLADVDQILMETGVDPTAIKLEITESAIMDNAEMAIALTQALRSRGLQISIDDFGTGYSSLGYLHRFPVDILKIDRSFIHVINPNSTASNSSYQVVETIITLAQQLGLTVVAEGIETQAQLAWLQHLDCEFGQGYLFAKPLNAADIEDQFLPRLS
ncbi:MAG: EAL domain-containing protein [Spirulina sp. DLM2.Bin59]|nr:MAG: EAL domain-containing protein [Spirulina sp. DLM2.Bin59]